MADLAIGISKTVVEKLVNKVRSAVKEEAEKWQILQRDIVFIKDEFEMMQSFLNTTGPERMNNQVARTWVRQVRDLSYDTEDCIEFVLHLDTKRSTFFWQFFRLLQPKVVPATLPLDQAVAEIKQLKSQAEDVNQRNIRYSLTGSSGEPMLPTPAASHRTLDIFIKPRDGFDNQAGTLDLARLIKREGKELQVIAVCGTGGDLGTTSIIKKVYDEPEICGMYQCHAWVKLMHPFSPHEFIRSLMAEFITNSPKTQEPKTQEPNSQEPKTLEANSQEPKTQEPNSQEPKTLEPNSQEPKTLESNSQDPKTQEPKTLEPNSQEPNTQEQGVNNVRLQKVLEMMKATQDSILAEFMERIKEKPYLIVLEDLSSVVEWNAIKTFLLDMKNGSRVVVSTQQLEIASLCAGQPYHVWLLREFSTEHSVYAFFSKEIPKDPQGNKTTTPEECRNDRGTASEHWLKGHGLRGRSSELRTLQHQVESHRVVSVCGVAGAGKSFIIQALHTHYTTTVRGISVRGRWYGVSSYVVSVPHPFDITDFCESLFLEIFSTPPEEGQDIFQTCWKHLKENRCWVFIDGLRSKEDWDLIEANLIPAASFTYGCTIVITREESVARHCATSADAVCRVKGLEADEARHLFQDTYTSYGTSKRDSNMMAEAVMTEAVMAEVDLIIDKCGRLPKLVVALAEYLAEVPNVVREARRLNANFMYALKTTRKGLDSFRDVFTWMYSRFQACHQLLRKCIFYLSLFTQSSIIRRNRLVRRWIAEGYSEGTDSNSMVEYTEKLIHELVTTGMMETHTKTGDMRTTSCQINSLFLDYFISRETEENIFLPLEVSVLVEDSTMNTQRAGQHLAIGSSWKRDKFVFESLDFSRLRSLTVSREWKPFFISDRMRVLRVLDLEDTSITDDDVEETVKKLPRLKFLSLRRCTKVSCLPDLLGNLRQLQSLDIKHTSVTKLPKSIIKLQKLQYINAGTKVALTNEEPSTSRRSRHGHIDACEGVMVPRGIGALIALHRLGVVNVNTRTGKATLKELKNLTQLHKLGVSGISRSNIKGLFSAIVGHSHLESLSLQLHMDKDLDWLAKLTSPGNLQRLKIHVHVEKYTHWSCLQALGQVRRLQILSFHFKTDQDVELQFSDMMDSGTWYTPNQFCELKVLEVACNSNLHVKFAAREMTELEMLKVHCLEGSSLKFSGIERPAKLKHVWLKGSFDDTVKAELRQKVNQHKNKDIDLKLD